MAQNDCVSSLPSCMPLYQLVDWLWTHYGHFGGREYSCLPIHLAMGNVNNGLELIWKLELQLILTLGLELIWTLGK